MKRNITYILFFIPLLFSAQTNKQPNIVLILTDQHNAQALSYMGNKNVSTPNLDQLARTGMYFDNAYVTFPLCTPSRSSMFTGKMPHSIGVNSNKDGDNRIISNEKQNVLGSVLTNAGYDCAYGGKWHAHEASMSAGNGFEFIAPMGDIGLAEKSVAYIESKKKSKKPFFLVVSFDNPHNICEWARNEPLPYGNVSIPDIDKTPNLPKNFKKSSSFPEVVQLEQNANKKVYPTSNYTENDWRNYLYAYYRLVEKVDFEIGKIINAIDQNKLREETIIIFTSDHGDGNAAHGWNQKTILFQESVKVPFIANYKGVIKPEKTTNNTLVSNGLDLYPTICAFAGINKKKLPGKNLKDIFLSKKKQLDREYVIVETKFEGKQALGTTGRTVITNKYKYILYNWGKNREQLFDLEKDPYEMNNLVNSTYHNEILDNMRNTLHKWCIENKDYKFLKKVILPSKSDVSSSTLFMTPY
ncbi:sulfatase family protein [Flavicella marina]|uniref:sulfatase family protein n=1 Tax=Flavicella marina TaxID=1475951 RepID=UPI001265363D|nr:sulfatase-like hydrolase/transferase [Flavicella marina]